jgi:hypothetical protein
MKSLRYRLLGLPVTLEDALAYSRKSRPRRVKVRLRVWRFVGEMDVCTQLVARLHWEFPGRDVRCEKVLGRVEGAWVGRPETNVAEANRRLAGLRGALASTGAEVVDADDRFATEPPYVASPLGEERDTLVAKGDQA